MGYTPAPQPTFSLWSKGQILQFAVFGPENITISCRSIVGFWFMCHTWYFRDHPEDHYQVDSERGDMGELNMIMENVINIACRTFIKMPAPIEDEFTKMRTITRWTASRGTWGSPSWLWRMLSLLLLAPLSKCQHTWKMNLQKWGPLPGGQWVEGHGEVHHDHGEYYRNYLLLLFQNAGTQWRQFHINHYCMTSNLVPLILTLRMKFRMTFRSGHV